jgi:hypothetical protein
MLRIAAFYFPDCAGMLYPMKTQMFLVLLLAGIARGEMGNPKDIPEAGRIRVDGQLNDWRKAKWAPLKKNLAGNPADISNAQWSIQWNDDPTLLIAVRYDDAYPVLGTGTNLQDCVKIYVRGDTGSEPLDYSTDQISAQQYIFGLSTNQLTTWKKLAHTHPFPAHNPATAAITLTGNTFTYEISVPLYDEFYAASKRETQTTEVMEELEIGVDIAIVDVGPTGYTGLKSENILPDKNHNADSIAEHTLGE